MLHADTYWRRKQTASFLFQILVMRLAALKAQKPKKDWAVTFTEGLIKTLILRYSQLEFSVLVSWSQPKWYATSLMVYSFLIPSSFFLPTP
jgi:hypothetical protein